MIQGKVTAKLMIEVSLTDDELVSFDDICDVIHDSNRKKAMYNEIMGRIVTRGLTVRPFNPVDLDVELDDDQEAEYQAKLDREYEHDMAQFRKMDEVMEELGIEESRWSMSSLDGKEDIDYKSLVIDDHPTTLKGRIKLMDATGWDEGTHYSAVWANPSYRDLWCMHEEIMRKTDDKHHCFLEGIHFKHTDDDGVDVYQVVTGS